MRKLLCSILVFVLILSIMPTQVVHAGDADPIITTPTWQDGTYKVTLSGRYKQTEARAMLSAINDFRTGDDAWVSTFTSDYYGTDISPDKCVQYYDNLPKVQYDYELEKYAMMRAAEIAFYYDHSRSRNLFENSLAELMNNHPEISVSSENLHLGMNLSAAQAFEDWKETDGIYAGQGHRRNMLGIGKDLKPNGTIAVGIACFNYNNVNYWVQIFADKTLDTSYKAANDSATNVEIEVSKNLMQKVMLGFLNQGYLDKNGQLDQALSDLNESKLVLYPGEEVNASSIYEFLISSRINCADGIYYAIRLPVKGEFTVGDKSIVDVQNGKIIGKKKGQTTISVQSQITGEELKMDVYVEQSDFTNAILYYESYDFLYTGKEIRPVTILVIGDERLEEGSDYTVTYTNNIKPGVATVTVNGIHKYQGATLSETFDIYKKVISCDATLRFQKKTYNYTGKAIKPEYTVLDNKTNRTLVEGTDYTVKYENNKKVGEAKVVLTGIGQYEGTLAGLFYIKEGKSQVKERLKKGKTFTYKDITYKVLSSSDKKGTVTVVKTTKSAKTVTIPATVKDKNGLSYTVTGISASAFKNDKKLTTLEVGKNIKKIDEKAFNGCKKLKSITLQNTKAKIGKNAFKGIVSKATVKIKSGSKTEKEKFLKSINKTGGAKNAKLK